MTMLLVLSCALTAMAQDVEYKITGVMPKGTTMGMLVQAGARQPLQVDSIKADGKFCFTGKAPKNALLLVYYRGEKLPHNIALFNDGTPVEGDFNTGAYKGSELNTKLVKFMNMLDENMLSQQKIYAESKDAKTTEARKKEIDNEMNRLDKESDDMIFKFYRENHDNVLPAALSSEYIYSFDYDHLTEYCDSTSGYYHHPLMGNAKRLLEGLAKRHEGLQFHELTMQDMEGKTVSLSQWVGKGQYVLVDFWASWCGPCRREMPTVVEAYKRYHASKGFNVVGVSFDNNADKWRAAVKELGMEWPQMSDLKGWQCAASKVYGVSSIPSNVLVDPQGKIIASDLRGEALLFKLKRIYEE